MISIQEFSKLINIEIDPNINFPSLTKAATVIKIPAWTTLNAAVPKTTLKEELEELLLQYKHTYRECTETLIYIKKNNKKPTIIIRDQVPRDLAYYKIISFFTKDLKLLNKLFKVYNMSIFL